MANNEEGFSFDDEENDDDEFTEDIDDDQDEEEDDELDDLDNEDDDEGEKEDLDEEDEEEQDDDIEAYADDVPIVLDQSEGVEEVDREAIGEEAPDEISEESWADLIGKDDFGFDDIAAYYDDADIYEIEIGVEYGQAAA